MLSMEYIIQLASAFLGSMGFALLFHIRREKLLLASLGGLLTWGVYLAAGLWVDQDVPRFFFASVAAAVYAEAMARLRRCPVTGYLLVALLPLVPGGGIYFAMSYCVAGDIQRFLDTLLHTFGMAAALAVGAMMTSSLFRAAYPYLHRTKPGA